MECGLHRLAVTVAQQALLIDISGAVAGSLVCMLGHTKGSAAKDRLLVEVPCELAQAVCCGGLQTLFVCERHEVA